MTTSTHHRSRLLFAGAAAIVAAPFALHAGAEASAFTDEAHAPPPADFKRIWDMFTLYENAENPILQEFAITGRYQGQYYSVDSNQGSDDDWENRRFRLGVKAMLFQDFEVAAEMFGDLNSGGDFYEGLTAAYIAWKPDEAFVLTLGKQKPKFSLDWSTSSREILTFERNILINNFGLDYETGISVGGKKGRWSYYGGVFSNDTGDPGDESEFGDLSGGSSYVAGIGYDLKGILPVEKSALRLDYLHSDHDADDDLLRKFDDSLAASLALRQGRYGLATEALYADGDRGEAWGFYLTPSYDITPKLQAVARYTFASSGDDILTAQRRYERAAPGITDGGNGETYHAGYLGLNYRIHGDKLKFMNGVEYANMNGGNDGGDFDGWTWSSGIRIYW